MARYDPDRRGYRIYVGNLSSQTSHDNLADLFRPHGPIVDIWLACNPPGFGFVVFKNANDAEQAVLAKNNSIYKGKTIKVQHARLFKNRSRRKAVGLSDEDTIESDRSTSKSRSRSRTRSRSRSSSRSRSRSRSLPLSQIYGRSTSRSRTPTRAASRSSSRSQSTSSRVSSRSRPTASGSASSARSLSMPRRSQDDKRRHHKAHRRSRPRRSGSSSASSSDDRSHRSEHSSSSAAPSRVSSSAVRKKHRRRPNRCPHCHHCMSASSSSSSSSSSSTSSHETRRRNKSRSASSGSWKSLPNQEEDRKSLQRNKNRRRLGRRRKSRSWESSSSLFSSSSSLRISSSAQQPQEILTDLHNLQKSREQEPVRQASEHAAGRLSLSWVASQEPQAEDEKRDYLCKTQSCQSESLLNNQENVPSAAAGDGQTARALSDSEAEKENARVESPSSHHDVSVTKDFPSADFPAEKSRPSSSRSVRTSTWGCPVASPSSANRSKCSAGFLKVSEDNRNPQHCSSSPGSALDKVSTVSTGNGDFQDVDTSLRSQPDNLVSDREHKEAVDHEEASQSDAQTSGLVFTASLLVTTATSDNTECLKGKERLQVEGTKLPQNEERLTERKDRMEMSNDVRLDPGETVGQNDTEIQAHKKPMNDAGDKRGKASSKISRINLLHSSSVPDNQETGNKDTEMIAGDASPVSGRDGKGKKMVDKSEHVGTCAQAEFLATDGKGRSESRRRFSPRRSPRATKHKEREDCIGDRRNKVPAREEGTRTRLPSNGSERKQNSGNYFPRQKAILNPECPSTSSDSHTRSCVHALRSPASAERQGGNKSRVRQTRGLSSHERTCSSKTTYQNAPKKQENEKSHLKDGREKNVPEFSTLSCRTRKTSRASQEGRVCPYQSRHTSEPSECKWRHRQESTSSRCKWRQGLDLRSTGKQWRHKESRSSYQEGRSRHRSPLTWPARERQSGRASRPSGSRERTQEATSLAVPSSENRPERLKGFSLQLPTARACSLTGQRRNRSPKNRRTREGHNALTSEIGKRENSRGRQGSNHRDKYDGSKAEATEFRKRHREDSARKDRTSSSPPVEARMMNKRLRKVSAQDASDAGSERSGAGQRETSSPEDRLHRKRLHSGDAGHEQNKRRLTCSLDPPRPLKKDPVTKSNRTNKRQGLRENGCTHKVTTKMPASGSSKPALLPLPKPGLLPLPSNEPPQLQPSLLDVPTSCQAFLATATDLLRSYSNDHVRSTKPGNLLQTHSSGSCPSLWVPSHLKRRPAALSECGHSGESASESLRGPLAGKGSRQSPACPRRTLLATPTLDRLASVVQSNDPSSARADGSRAKQMGRRPSQPSSGAKGPARTSQPTLTKGSRDSPTSRLHVDWSRAPAQTTHQEPRLKSAILLVKNK